MSKLALPRRLPGIAFEAVAPPLAESLPRMDIAVFVGFASSGPLHVPVAVEDTARFTEIFGPDLPLAWDEEKGQQVCAYLAPAVRSFFRNGGRRCWVIRVAAWRDSDNRVWPSDAYTPAESNRFPIPGLVHLCSCGSPPEFKPVQAYAEARSEGSWSDSLRIGTVQLSKSLGSGKAWKGNDGKYVVAIGSAAGLSSGDLLCLTFFNRSREILFLQVEKIEKPNDKSSHAPSMSPPMAETGAIWVTGTAGFCFRKLPSHNLDPQSEVKSPPFSGIDVEIFAEGGHPRQAKLKVLSVQDPNDIHLKIDLPPEDAPVSGSIVSIKFKGSVDDELWLNIHKTGPAEDGDMFESPPVKGTEVVGAGLWKPKGQTILSSPSLPEPVAVERLTFKLVARKSASKQERNNEPYWTVTDLSFVPGSARFWGHLPTDEQLFIPENESCLRKRPELERLWNDVRHPRFPISGPWAGEAKIPADTILSFPLGMSESFPKAEELYPALPSSQNRVERDGLARFSGDLFLDPALSGTSTDTLTATADFIRYQSKKPHHLLGIHAALGIEEAALIAVPDAVHRKWNPTKIEEAVRPESHQPFRPEWWHHLDCTLKAEEIEKRPEVVSAQKPAWDTFLNCSISSMPSTPKIREMNRDQSETFTISWSPVQAATYILEEATSSDWAGASAVYTGKESSITLYSYPHGIHYFRVCAEINKVRGNWSKGKEVNVLSPARWKLEKSNVCSSDAIDSLCGAHRALLKVCAARGDLFAVLALPERFREEDSTAYVERLKSEAYQGGLNVAALDTGESKELSYGAVYHPWLISEEEGETVLRSIPPDGAICGMMAKRALSRGAWVAPANELMSGILTLTPSMDDARRLELQQTHINLVRQEPQGFVTLSAETLSDNPDLRPINVRRLLSLLRRLALRLGARYVFEPNDDSFRRLVRCGFEALLDDMFMRGAFAGNSPKASYQVVTSTSINTPQSMDQGRFIVELRVAPSLPMTFITVRLLQSADRLSVSEGR